MTAGLDARFFPAFRCPWGRYLLHEHCIRTSMSTADQHSVILHNYLELAALSEVHAQLTEFKDYNSARIAIFYYDYFITLPNEISRIWSRPLSRPAIWFFINRYVPFFGNIVVSVFSFTNLASSEKSCRTYGLARQLLLVANQVIVAILLAMRIYALWSGSHTIVIIVGSVSSVLAAMTVWALLGQHSSVVADVQGCHIATSFITGVHIAVAWEAQAVFDIMMVVLTIVKTLQTRRQLGARLLSEKWELIDLIVRDGAIYFVVMAAANLANILTFYLANPILKGVLSTFAGCISITMMARLMLNLYGAATPQPTARTSTTLPSLFFTTRIDASGTAPTFSGVFPDGPAPPSGVVREGLDEEQAVQEIELEERGTP